MSETPIIIKKKKGHGGHAHHGGSWKVAYADFVTAMMAFFMVMWIMGLSDQTKLLIQGYFNDPLGFTKNQPRLRSVVSPKGVTAMKQGPGQLAAKAGAQKLREDELKQIRARITQALSSAGDLKTLLKNVEITVTPEGLRIELLENSGAMFFESGKAVIRPQAMELIHRMAPILAKTSRKMIIEGHTDAKAFAGTGYTNWDLSTDRALALRRALSGFGVSDSQFLSVRGYAATQLRDRGDPYNYSNRRVTILLPFDDGTENQVDMPKEELKRRLQGEFRNPTDVAPDLPGIRPSQEKSQ
jgi:chemotaxis protein MotB